jgi:hypothetical protein
MLLLLSWYVAASYSFAGADGKLIAWSFVNSLAQKREEPTPIAFDQLWQSDFTISRSSVGGGTISPPSSMTTRASIIAGKLCAAMRAENKGRLWLFGEVGCRFTV